MLSMILGSLFTIWTLINLEISRLYKWFTEIDRLQNELEFLFVTVRIALEWYEVISTAYAVWQIKYRNIIMGCQKNNCLEYKDDVCELYLETFCVSQIPPIFRVLYSISSTSCVCGHACVQSIIMRWFVKNVFWSNSDDRECNLCLRMLQLYTKKKFTSPNSNAVADYPFQVLLRNCTKQLCNNLFNHDHIPILKHPIVDLDNKFYNENSYKSVSVGMLSNSSVDFLVTSFQ